jgi:hypothetical protein
LQATKFPKRREPPKNILSDSAEDLMWPLLEDLRTKELVATIGFGNLLGLSRDGKFLDGEKDIDIICWLHQFDAITKYFEGNGYHEDVSLRCSNSRAYLPPDRSNMSIDLMGIQRNVEDGSINAGFWNLEAGFQWSMVSKYRPFDIVPRTVKGHEVYWIDQVEQYLTDHYGHWRERDENYINYVTEPSLLPTALRLYYCKVQILRKWMVGDFDNALRFSFESLKIYPGDPIILNCVRNLTQVKSLLKKN